MSKQTDLLNLTDAITVDSSNNVGIGTSSPADVLHVVTPSFGGITLECTGATADPTFKFLGDSGNYWSLQQDASQGDSFQFRYNNSEKIRIDSSGNLLVGKTSANSDIAGFEANASGFTAATRDNGTVFVMDRLTSDGGILSFRKNNTTVGSIGTDSSSTGSNSLTIDSGSDGAVTIDGIFRVLASKHTGTPRIAPFVDNTIDVGGITARFDDIFATNGTIQTSDRNEKQDIEVLSDAEQRVAVACKGLLRKFRWKDAVAEKGDDARIHFGIIAQDLQDAFTAEGLDAGRYAMFISSTWWEAQTEVPAVEADEENGIEAKDAYTRTDTYETLEEAPEGATERTRLGVRYPELLAFIIGAM